MVVSMLSHGHDLDDLGLPHHLGKLHTFGDGGSYCFTNIVGEQIMIDICSDHRNFWE